MIWALCLISVVGGLRDAHAGLIRNVSAMGRKAAPQEEVNVLMFGVIQFSESLNYAFETTEAKLAKISQALKNHEGTLQKLGKQTEQAADVEKQMKEAIQLLQVRKKCKQQWSHCNVTTAERTSANQRMYSHNMEEPLIRSH